VPVYKRPVFRQSSPKLDLVSNTNILESLPSASPFAHFLHKPLRVVSSNTRDFYSFKVLATSPPLSTSRTIKAPWSLNISTVGNLRLAVVRHLMCFGWTTFPTFNVYFYVFYTSFVTVGVIHCKVVSLGYLGALVHVAFATPCPGFNHGKTVPGGGHGSRSPLSSVHD